MNTTDKPSILITRLSHIGDCILTLPMVNAIKDQLPNAAIHWAVESPTQQLLEGHPAVDRLIMIPKSWAGKPSCWKELRQQLRQPAFDAVIDPQGITKSAGLGWLSGSRNRIGIRGRWGRELSPLLNNRLIETKSPHIVERSIELIAGLGLEPGANPPRFDLPVCLTAAQSVGNWLDEARLGSNGDRPFLVINPGGSWASKRWEMNRFGSVARYLKQTYGLVSVIVWAGQEERAMAETIHQRAPRATCIACPTSLRELAALASQATFFIGGDTGPLHIASAVGTPCVGLYGTTRPEESGAYGDHHVAVQKWYQGGSCRERRNADNEAMRDIQVADVNSACDILLNKQRLAQGRAA